MGFIVDANCTHKLVDVSNHPDFAPILAALTTGGAKLVYGGTKLQSEYERVDEVRRLIVKLDQAGKTLKIRGELVDRRERELKDMNACNSNDEHVIALAQLSGTRLLCTHDGGLHDDFTDKRLIDKPRGKVYQSARQHQHLIRVFGKVQYPPY